jgi:polar amino acid transport system ATP-binding protein
MLDVRKLSCAIGGRAILNQVSFHVSAGEICTIIGGSGAGKTTVMRILCGLEQRFTGNIFVNGRENRNGFFGLVPQGDSLFKHFSVMENVTYALRKVKKYSKRQATGIATEVLSKLELQDKLESYPSGLSGGQKQRVAIARTLVMEPKVLLFDEPTSALDPEVTRGVIKTIRDLSATGISVLIVTHDIPLARQVTTHVLFLDEGRIVEDRCARDFFANPLSDRAKRFIDANI